MKAARTSFVRAAFLLVRLFLPKAENKKHIFAFFYIVLK